MKKKLGGEHAALVGIVVAVVIAFACVVYMVNAMLDMQAALASGASFWDAAGAGHPQLAENRTRSIFCVFCAFLAALAMGGWGIVKWRDNSFERKNPSSVLEATVLMQQKELAALRRRTKEDKNEEDDGQFTD